MRVAVLASGSGSNLQALLDAAREPGFPAQIALVLSNNPEAYALRRAEQAGVPTAVINHRDFPDRPTFEAAVQEALSAASINFCLSGGIHADSDCWFRGTVAGQDVEHPPVTAAGLPGAGHSRPRPCRRQNRAWLHRAFRPARPG